MTKINTGNANREYKDRLFRFVFGAEENKAYLLSLCNAVSGTDYTDVDDIEITTLSNAIYIKMKNDISFLIDSQMNLFEHQSTFNPNMPLRGMRTVWNLYYRKWLRHLCEFSTENPNAKILCFLQWNRETSRCS